MAAPAPRSWIDVRPEGLYVRPGDFYVDPVRSVSTAVVSHGHADHARPGHDTVLATADTVAIMEARLRDQAGRNRRPLSFRERIEIGDVTVWLAPAGHVLGSAQVVLEYKGSRVVVSGDYKRADDPTCAAFEPVPCDAFVTEATFGLPVFRHPDDRAEIDKLLASVALFPERCHVVGVYALGKAQRVIALLRERGWDRPIYIHGALRSLCDLYAARGVELGDLRDATAGQKGVAREDFRGEIVLAPPSAIADRWGRRLPDPVVAMASGWMRVKQRAKQRGVELPLIISDHADWDGLVDTIREVAAPEVWVTHGREEALVHQARLDGFNAEALRLVGYEEDET